MRSIEPVFYVLTALAALGCTESGSPSTSAGSSDGAVVDQSLDGGAADGGAAVADAAAEGDVGAAADAGPNVDPLQIRTEAGLVLGVQGVGHARWLGIPYAQPPVGALRLRSPVPHPGWQTALDTTQFGPECPQRDGDVVVGEEDCLTLNVWRPVGEGPLPVMVFIHGGAFVQGSASVPVYDGATLAEAGEVVVVTLNYRIGALGFLATEALAGESDGGGAGNYGIEDQQLALRWVRSNIAAFGGDPDRVTIFGESAGGVSVCVHMGAPGSEGLFERAIIQSGRCSGWPRLRDGEAKAPAVEVGAQIVEAAGCAGDGALECLRGLTAEALVDATWSASPSGLGAPDVGPNVDGVVIKAQTLALFERGEARDIPVLMGTNADESRTFLTAIPVPTAAAFERLVRAQMPTFADALLELYPVDAFDSPKLAYEALFSDVGFICPAISFVRIAAGGEPSFAYHFTHTLSGAAARFGSPHAAELLFVFDGLDTLGRYRATAADGRVVAAFQGTWADFAYGRPMAAGGTDWPAYDPDAETIMGFADPIYLTREIREGRCEVLRELGVVR